MPVSRWSICCLASVIGCTPGAEVSKPHSTPVVVDPAEKVVRQVIGKLLKADPASIAMDKSIAAPPLKADELDIVEIVMDLEERLHIEVSDAAIERYNGGQLSAAVRITPNQLIAMVKEAPKAQESKQKKDQP